MAMKIQAIFDKITQHLRTMDGQCVLGSGEITHCVYRGPDGTKCAAGVMIPDSLYTSDMEHNAFSSICNMFPAVGRRYTLKQRQLIQSFVPVHDERANWTNNKLNVHGELQIKLIAEEWGLIYSTRDETNEESPQDPSTAL